MRRVYAARFLGTRVHKVDAQHIEHLRNLCGRLHSIQLIVFLYRYGHAVFRSEVSEVSRRLLLCPALPVSCKMISLLSLGQNAREVPGGCGSWSELEM